MPEQLWITQILNHALAAPVTALLHALHIEPTYPAAPISNGFAMELLVFGFLVLLFLAVRSKLSVDNPGALQHRFEGVHGFINGQSEGIIGHHSEVYTPFLRGAIPPEIFWSPASRSRYCSSAYSLHNLNSVWYKSILSGVRTAVSRYLKHVCLRRNRNAVAQNSEPAFFFREAQLL